MFLLSPLTVFFFIGLFCVYPGSGQYDIEFPNNYLDHPEMLTRMNSIVRTSQDLNNINDDQEGFSILKQYSDLSSYDSIYQFLKDMWANADNDRCSQDMKYAFDDPQANDKVGLKMLDAFGKTESGILEGNVRWFGNYHECTNVHAPPNENSTAGDFNGQYCLLDVSGEIYDRTVPLSLGVCLPDSCASVPIKHFNVPQIGFYGNVTGKTCQLTSRKLTSAAVAMICVLSFFVILALVGSSISVYEYMAKAITQDSLVHYGEQINEGSSMEIQIQDSSPNATSKHDKRDNNGWYGTVREFFACFCIFTNGEKILNTDNTEGQMLCLHGIRFLSMAWVILCHAYGILKHNLGNPMEAITTINTVPSQIIINGYYCVDSFFLLSGFLVAYLYFQEAAKKKGKISWLYFYIHRYVRLTPVYAMVLGFFTTLHYYVGSGPIWQTNEIEPVCKENWFYNLLYINNFRNPPNNCMPWTWYLANDMQFFIISPIILITLWRWPKIGYAVFGLFMSVTVAANLGLTYHYNLLSGYGKASDDVAIIEKEMQGSMEDQNIFYIHIYAKPYTRMSPYLVGIALAYFLIKRKQSKAGRLNLITLVCGWIVGPAASLACLFCLYNRKLSVTESAFYNALGHVGFTSGISWVIFTCLNKQAEPVDKILSFKLFIPLSRLTYSAYLIHPLVAMGYLVAMKTTLHFSHMTMVTLYLGLLVITYAFSFLVSVLLESPIIRLEKLLRTKLMS